MRRIAVSAVLLLAFAAQPALSEAAQPSVGSDVAVVQARLAALGYLARTAVTGKMDDATRQAVVAFQAWEGLERTGLVDTPTRALLPTAGRPVAPPGLGSRIEVDLTRQVALLARGARVIRVVHVSTGAPGTPTPSGRFRVYRKERQSWSVPFHVWLPWASYFAGGVALHGSVDVPAYPASHGCVRIPLSEAPVVYAFARLGVSVHVVT